MQKAIAACLCVAALAAAPVFAQGHGNPPDPATAAQFRVNRLTKLLSLSSSQQQQALTIFTAVATTASSLRDSLKAAHQNLQTAVQKNDTGAIDQASTTVGNLTAQLTSAEAKANAAFYQILDPSQQSKFVEFASQGPRGFGHGRGPGGPGGQ